MTVENCLLFSHEDCANYEIPSKKVFKESSFNYKKMFYDGFIHAHEKYKSQCNKCHVMGHSLPENIEWRVQVIKHDSNYQ